MATKRRVGAENSETRARIVEAAEAVIRDDGYAAVSTRKVATRLGLPASLVHYYFPATEDLWLAVFRRGAAQSDAMIDAAAADHDPVRALWRFHADASRAALSLEFMALANRHASLRAAIADHVAAMRARESDMFARAIGARLAEAPRATPGVSPEALSVLLAGVGRALVMEGAMGVSAGHADARAWIDGWLDALLGTRPA